MATETVQLEVDVPEGDAEAELAAINPELAAALKDGASEEAVNALLDAAVRRVKDASQELADMERQVS